MACQVILLGHTPDPDRIVAAAARLCYSAVPASSIMEEQNSDSVVSLITHLRKSGHLSPLEHASFTFSLDGISRVTSHQLVRHRIASYSQRSQRYVSMVEPNVVLPPTVAADKEATDLFVHQVESAHNTYLALLKRGVPKEDARYILPHGWTTSLVMTMNARELLHFFSLRLCRRAQWEIQELARKMLIEVRQVSPVIFALAGPSCVVNGVCGEARPCGKPFRSVEELLEEE
ncbi:MULTISPECIES: FAD-dependent thymidylate synthase [Aminobacterium]|nr:MULTISPECIES: FAD-dependent thymidylate synthase [unclassified Aminobacterium]